MTNATSTAFLPKDENYEDIAMNETTKKSLLKQIFFFLDCFGSSGCRYSGFNESRKVQNLFSQKN